MRTSTKLFIFAAGALVGSLFTWSYTKKYYEKIANDEIESMKEWLNRRVKEQEEKTEDRFAEPAEKPATSPSTKPDLMEYAAMVKSLGYTDYSRKPEEAKPEEGNEEVETMNNWPYVIEPEEFGECGYEEVSLTHYADGVLTDEQDNPIEDVDGTVGDDYADHFGEYEDDSVFVRNDTMRIDFEILADQRKFSDLGKIVSDPAEDE